MTQKERRLFLIQALFSEQPRYAGLQIPSSEPEQKKLLRSLFNIRMPKTASREFLEIQDAYLKAEIEKKGITDIADLAPVWDNIYLWQGDITTLRCDAIVNAANSQMLGCFCPCHGCIDNAIHTFSGVQLRLECAEIMREQGFEEPIGRAKITSAYNLPCGKIIHTVGPYVDGKLTEKHCEQLRSCYSECLKTAVQNGISSIAFCCISTGEFHFPNDKAAGIAVETVRDFLKNNKNIEVVFNVFKDEDFRIYNELLSGN